jgi:hypothetical protein
MKRAQRLLRVLSARSPTLFRRLVATPKEAQLVDVYLLRGDVPSARVFIGVEELVEAVVHLKGAALALCDDRHLVGGVTPQGERPVDERRGLISLEVHQDVLTREVTMQERARLIFRG